MTWKTVAYRYLAGRPLDGRAGYPYLRPGAGRLAGWQRQIARVAIPAATVLAAAEPHNAAVAATMAGIVAVVGVRRRLLRRRFRREYIAPTLAAVTAPLGGVPVKLHVDPGLGNLTPRLAKPLSPAERHLRRVYGEHVEPVLRWPADRAMRGLWLLQRIAIPVTSRVAAAVRRPGEKPGPRIELTASTPYLTAEQRKLISSIITSKLPVSDLVETWDQVGAKVTGTWVVRKRPPSQVGYDELVAAMPRLAEWEFYIGQGPGNTAVTISLKDDSPHIAVSAGSGAGKSVLAQLLAVQVLARGGRVTILDRKGSHRWALGLPGVDYCTKPAAMHNALIRLAGLADQRNTDALDEPEDWDPGVRHLVIVEELNATIGQLMTYWADIREKSDPKKSPGVTSLAEILFMGRAAKINALAIAQMLTARAIGGPEARENFGIRFLARFTSNAWKMLVPEAAQPRASRTLGRWQVVIGGTAVEVQVCYLTGAQARAIAAPVTGRAEDPDSGLSSTVTGNGGETGNTVDPLAEPITIREAIAEGVLPWGKDAVKMRMLRARKAGRPVPAVVGKRGMQTALYRRGDLIIWAESEKVS